MGSIPVGGLWGPRKIGRSQQATPILKSIEVRSASFPFLIFQVSEISESAEHPRGSESHANIVKTSIRDIYKFLPSRNIFRPKVLAKASHNNNWFVGSSISCS